MIFELFYHFNLFFINRLIMSFLITYFYGRIIYSFFASNTKNLISIIHSLFLGFGFTSITFWFYTIATNGYNSNYYIIELCIVPIVYFYLFFMRKKWKSLPKRNKSNKYNFTNTINDSNKSFLKNISYLIIVLIVILSLFNCLRYPEGKWDAAAMWNIKAKFLVCGNESWSGMFSDYYIYFHRDYPLLLPCIIARTYNYLGGVHIIIPLLFSWLFTISCFVLPYLYLKKLKNYYFAVFSLCILVFSQSIINEGSKQYADIPLAVYFLITLYELIEWDIKAIKLPCLCICFSSLCFWIKNEGIPWFIIYTLLVIFYLYKKEKQWKKTLQHSFSILAISLPVIIAVMSVKYLANCENDIEFELFGRLKQIIEIERYKIIMSYVWIFIKQHFWIMVIPIYIFVGFIDKKYYKYKYLLFLILFMFLVYFFVYLVTPYDLQWHLLTSFKRIYIVYLPSLIFLGCLLFELKINKK